jgi:hypothetical protein
MVRVKLKNRIQISNSVDKEIWAAFQKLSADSRIPLFRLLDEAMQDLIKKHKK